MGRSLGDVQVDPLLVLLRAQEDLVRAFNHWCIDHTPEQERELLELINLTDWLLEWAKWC